MKECETVVGVSSSALHALNKLMTPPVGIVGMGQEGISTYRFLRKYFAHLPMVLVDRAPLEKLSPLVQELAHTDPLVTLRTGAEAMEYLSDCSVLFRSPGIPPDATPLVRAREQGKVILSNTKLFFRLCPGRIIGVTGTKGKSTTTALITAILERAGMQPTMVGNIGIPPLSALECPSSSSLFVAELSSYQLADMDQSPHIAVVLNIVPEHLPYHKTFEAYIEAKSPIVRYQSTHDVLVYQADYPIPTRFATISRAQAKGVRVLSELHPWDTASYGIVDEWLGRKTPMGFQPIMRVAEVPLPGRFNLHNVLAAIAVACEIGVDPPIIADAIRAFTPLEHRLEYVGQVGEVKFYNDSLSTVPEATIAAVESMYPTPVVLIAGGYDRGVDYRGLARVLLSHPIRALVLFPPSGERIWQAITTLAQERSGVEPCTLPPCCWAVGMRDAVELAWQVAKPGDVVLLSPASASFSQFADYRDRGQQFKSEVRRLQSCLVSVSRDSE